jgi:uncharacterized protein (DUF433 family)
MRSAIGSPAVETKPGRCKGDGGPTRRPLGLLGLVHLADQRFCDYDANRGATVTLVAESHIVLDDRGVAWINGTNTKVIEVVLDKLADDWGPEKIHEEYPHLSLGQIHAAFAYYYDHQAQMDEEIERQLRDVDERAAKAAIGSPIRRNLRAMGKLP